MSTLISSPFPVFTDASGLPLENGYIDIGVAGLNPLSNPRQAYWDEALTIPAVNIRTSRGYPSKNGGVGFLYTAPGDFSILVRNKNGSVILSNPTVIDNITSLQNAVLNNAELALQNSHVIGELVLSEFDDVPSASFPAIPRNIDQDVDIANWPLLVTKARSKAISVLGVTDHAVNVAGAVITFGATPEANALLALFINDGIVTNYVNGGEIANFVGGAVYNVPAAQRSVTMSGVDYTVIGVDAVPRTITVSVNPPAGAASLSVYPHRIGGNANAARFLRIAGFVGVAAGDAGGEVVGGFRKMDRSQGRKNNVPVYIAGISGAAGSTSVQGVNNAAGGNVASIVTTDGTNGTARTGKTTDPRTAGLYAYTWGGKYLP